MSATVESLEMLRAGPKRWFLVSAVGVLSWTEVLAEASRFEDLEAEALCSPAFRDSLPVLPTAPAPKVPMWLRVVHGSEPDLPLPGAVISRADDDDEEAPRRRVAAAAAPARAYPRKASPAEVFEDLERRHLA